MPVEITSEEYELILNTFVFKNMDSKVLLASLKQEGCAAKDYQKGDTVFSPTSYYKALGILTSGSLLVSKTTDDGHSLPISRLGRGEVFGAAAIFNDFESFVTILTAETSCRVLYFSESLIKSMMKSDFTVAENYIRYQSGRIRFLSGKIDGLAAGSAENRLARYLLEYSGEGGAVAATMTELAGMLNIGRASLYRAIDALCQAGAIEKQGKKLKVISKERLQ